MILSQIIPQRRSIALDVFEHGFFNCNPSIVKSDYGYISIVKGINYDREAIYRECDWSSIDKQQRILIRHRIVYLDNDLQILSVADLEIPEVSANPPFYVDIEDIRLFYFQNRLMAMGTYLRHKGVSVGQRWIMTDQTWRVFIAKLDGNKLIDLQIFDSLVGEKWEKNWIPCVRSSTELSLIANINTGARIDIVRGSGNRTSIRQSGETRDFHWRGGWSGSSCLVACAEGYLGVVHCNLSQPPQVYRHMFILVDRHLNIRRRSRDFSFKGLPIEFCCGLVVDEDEDTAMIAYSQFDRSALLAELRLSDIKELLEFEVAEGTSIREVGCQHTVPLSLALECLAEHEKHIWRLIDELLAAQAQSDALSRRIAETEASRCSRAADPLSASTHDGSKE